jgi:hypothetical protein
MRSGSAAVSRPSASKRRSFEPRAGAVEADRRLRIAPAAETSLKSSTVPLIATSVDQARCRPTASSIVRKAGRKRGVRFGGGVLRACTSMRTESMRALRAHALPEQRQDLEPRLQVLDRAARPARAPAGSGAASGRRRSCPRHPRPASRIVADALGQPRGDELQPALGVGEEVQQPAGIAASSSTRIAADSVSLRTTARGLRASARS